MPNGRSLDDPHYRYKLDWLEALRGYTAQTLAADPDLALALTGDFNIAPTDADNGDPTVHRGRHDPRLAAGAGGVPRAAWMPGCPTPCAPSCRTGYTYWDYKQLRFPRNEGLRIDFILGSPAFADAVAGAAHPPRRAQGRRPERPRAGASSTSTSRAMTTTIGR